MILRTREAWLGAAIVFVAVLGMSVDVIGDQVDRGPEPAVEGERVAARSVFCPPTVPAESDSYVAVFSPSSRPVDVALGSDSSKTATLAGDRALVQETTPPRESGDRSSVRIEGYGERLGAGAIARTSKGVDGLGAAPCTDQASTEWYFPEGSSAIGYDERLLLLNPFSDEAVVRVTFFTGAGEITKASLDDVAVPANDSAVVAVNDFVFRHRFLSAKVTAVRGRVVGWRMLIADPDNKPAGVQLSLGSPRPAARWYFPEGGVGDAYDERLALMNPTDEEAIVTVSLVTGDTVLQPDQLLEVPIKRESSMSISLADAGVRGRDEGPISVTVSSINGQPIVAERTIWYSSTDGVSGVASEVGSTVASVGWSLPPAARHPTSDVVVLLNPGAGDAVVDIALVGVSDSLTPAALTGLEVPSGLRLRVPVGQWTDGRPMVAVVTSTTGIVAERFSYSSSASDVASVMGRPNVVKAGPGG